MQPGRALSDLPEVFSTSEAQSKCHLVHEIITDPAPYTDASSLYVSIAHG